MECAVNVRSLAWIGDALAGQARLDGVAIRTDIGDADNSTWHGAAIDSRADCSGRIFFAITGERTDGHRFVAHAVAAGAVAVVIDDPDCVSTLEAENTPCPTPSS